MTVDVLMPLRLMWRASFGPAYEKREAQRRRARQIQRDFDYRDSSIDGEALDWFRRLTPTMAPVTRLIGDGADGSYLVPDLDFGPLSVFSPGVGGSVEFELVFAEEGHEVFLADGTIDQLPKNHRNFSFTPKNIGDGPAEIGLGAWMEGALVSGRSPVLQVDIEGAEWQALLPTGIEEGLLRRIEWMVVEFHDFERVWDIDFKVNADIVLERILDLFVPIVAHPNNCAPSVRLGKLDLPTVFEMTFLNKRHLDKATIRFPDLPTAFHTNCARKPRLAWPSVSGYGL